MRRAEPAVLSDSTALVSALPSDLPPGTTTVRPEGKNLIGHRGPSGPLCTGGSCWEAIGVFGPQPVASQRMRLWLAQTRQVTAHRHTWPTASVSLGLPHRGHKVRGLKQQKRPSAVPQAGSRAGFLWGSEGKFIPASLHLLVWLAILGVPWLLDTSVLSVPPSSGGLLCAFPVTTPGVGLGPPSSSMASSSIGFICKDLVSK